MPYLAVRRALIGATLIALLVPAAASAAPDRSATLNSATAQFAWDGPAGEGSYDPLGDYDVANCSKEPETYCDQTLVLVESGGPVTLDAAIGDYSNPLADYDLYIYKSNERGTATEDDLMSEAGIPSNAGLPFAFEETATVEDAEPGYYLINVVYYESFGGSYKGSATVTGATPVPGSGGGEQPPPPSGGEQPPPPSGGEQPPAEPTRTELPFKAASSTLGSAKKAKKRRSLKFKVTAEEAITDLKVALRKGRRTLGSVSLASLRAGTSTLRLRVSRKLKKGKYSLLASGVVDGQTLETVQAVKLRK